MLEEVGPVIELGLVDRTHREVERQRGQDARGGRVVDGVQRLRDVGVVRGLQGLRDLPGLVLLRLTLHVVSPPGIRALAARPRTGACCPRPGARPPRCGSRSPRPRARSRGWDGIRRSPTSSPAAASLAVGPSRARSSARARACGSARPAPAPA